MVSLILDILIIAIIALAVWRGYKGGIIVGVCAAVALFVALIAGNIAATVYASEFEGALSTFGTGLVDTAHTDTIEFKGLDEDGQPDDSYPILTEAEKKDVHTVSFNVMRRIGLAEAPSEDIAAETAEEVETVGQTMRNVLTDKMCAKLASAIVFMIVSALVAIIFAAIGNIINLSFELPGAQVVNNIVGALIGLLNGVVIVMLVTCLFRYSGVIIGKHAVESAKLTSWFTNHNFIASIFGI